MFKTLLITFACLKTIVSFPQSAPISTGNTYTYTEKDGIDETNFFACGLASTGEVFLHAHTGSLFIKGNNYVRKLHFPNNSAPLHILMMYEVAPGKFYAFGDAFYYHISGDSIISTTPYPTKSFHIFSMGQSIAGVDPGGAKQIYLFKEGSFAPIYTVHCDKGQPRLYIDSLQTIWQVNYYLNKTRYYKVINLKTPEFMFSAGPALNKSRFENIRLSTPVSLYLIPIENYSYQQGYVSGLQNSFHLQPFTISDMGSHWYEVRDNKSGSKQALYYKDKIMEQNLYHSFSNSFYFGSFNKPVRYFPYLQKYPNLFGTRSASSIHVIEQDSTGRIWAGSYEDGLAIIDKDKIISKKERDLAFLPGGFCTQNFVYLNTEKENGGLLKYDLQGRWTKENANGHFISAYFNENNGHVYLGSTTRGLWCSTLVSLESAKPTWKIIDSTKGNLIYNSISAITEDKKARVWMGGRLRGFAVYYPKADLAKTWLISKGETSFGVWSLLTDDWGTVWLGSDSQGLLFYNSDATDTIDAERIRRLEHPLLSPGSKVMFLAKWNKWLVIGTAKDILLLDLNEWHSTGKALIRYLNPEEENFTGTFQQNAVLVNGKDSSIWFATSDMLYRWNIKEWLAIPMYRVNPNLVVKTVMGDSTLAADKSITLSPTDNSLDFTVWFQTKDNMPRYLSAALLQKGNQPVFSEPSLQNQFRFENLASGSYNFFLRVFESDGSISIHRYSFIIRKFWWQNWWIWTLFLLTILIPILLFISARNKARLAREQFMRKEAELNAIRSEQERKLASHKIISLSNQFRPHFVLNALNTIGAGMDDKPGAEIVISRLGESIDLIFRHAQQQKITHSFNDEWRLVENVIEIHRSMYLKELELELPPEKLVEAINDIEVPLGLLQLPVENALLHGLGNKEEGPWKLSIKIDVNETSIIVNATDNGVGRKRAAGLSNYRNHGTGLKNLGSILEMLNAGKDERISINYEDGVFREGDQNYGTKVIISIPKNFHYDI